MDISDQCRIEQCFGFHPEIIAGFSVSLRVGDKRCHQLQNILFTVDIREGIVVVGLFEVDGIEDLRLNCSLEVTQQKGILLQKPFAVKFNR